MRFIFMMTGVLRCAFNAIFHRHKALFILQSLFIVGCSYSYSVPVDPPILEPLVDPISGSIAIHYSEELREHECIIEDFITIRPPFIVRIGPPSIEMFNSIFKNIFKEVNVLDSVHDFKFSLGNHSVIELRLSQFLGCDTTIANGPPTFFIIYEAIVWSANGERVAQWKGAGDASPSDVKRPLLELTVLDTIDYLTALTRVAMRRAAADFVVNYSKSPEVQAWATSRSE